MYTLNRTILQVYSRPYTIHLSPLSRAANAVFIYDTFWGKTPTLTRGKTPSLGVFPHH